MALSIGDQAPNLTLTNQEGQEVRLSHYWSEGPLFLLLIRHLGCPFCREDLLRLRKDYRSFQDAGGDVLAITMGDAAQTASFHKRLRLPFDCLADPDKSAYQAFQVERASIWKVAGPSVWLSGFKSMMKAGIGRVIGDVRQLPASFVIDSHGTLQMVAYPRTSIQHLDHAEIVRLLKKLAVPFVPPSESMAGL